MKQCAATDRFNPESSMAGHFAAPYKVTKAMVNRLTQLLAAQPEVQQRGIKVIAADPGWCRYARVRVCMAINLCA